MTARYSRRTGLPGELLISLASGVILAVGAQLLTAVVLPGISGSVPMWLFVAATPTAALLAFVVARRLSRTTDQAFVLISAFTHTRWLADLLDSLSGALDRNGVDLIVKLPPHDHAGRVQLAQLASLRRRRPSLVGGFVVFVVPEKPDGTSRELADLCKEIDLPLVFVDVRPFRDTSAYPAQTAFVGCDAREIGNRAARWTAQEFIELELENPAVLVVAGDAQVDRHKQFEARLREILPSSKIEVDPNGKFAREPARKIVDQHIQRHIVRRGERFDAIFCTNDEMALGAVDAVQQHASDQAKQHSSSDWRVDDLLVIGVDGIPEARATIEAGATPFRATIVQDAKHVAEVAVDILLRMRGGEPVATETFVPTAVYSK